MSTQIIGPKAWHRLRDVGLEVSHAGPGNVSVTVQDGYVTLPGDIADWEVRAAPIQQDGLLEDAQLLARVGFPMDAPDLPALLFLDTDGTLVSLAAETPPPDLGLTDRRRHLIRALLDLSLTRIKWKELL